MIKRYGSAKVFSSEQEMKDDITGAKKGGKPMPEKLRQRYEKLLRRELEKEAERG